MAAVARKVGLSSTQVSVICQQAARLEEQMQPQELSDELPVRAYNCLRNMGLAPEEITPERVAELSPRDLLRLPNFGRVSLKEVRDWLERHGHWWPPGYSQRMFLQIAIDKPADQVAAQIVEQCGPRSPAK